MESNSKLSDFDIQTRLGSGSYGVVFKVVRKSDKKVYVLKQVNLVNLKQKMRKNAINEASIMAKLRSPFVVQHLQSFIDRNYLNIIMEYCELGDLSLYLKQQSGRALKEERIWKIFLQVCLGLEYIHSRRILHRDIKTLNIFLQKDDRIKIGDLGVAKLLSDNMEFAQTMVGTPFYLSPELCEEKPYNEKSDIWALGCLLYEMCTFKHPFEAANQGSLILKIVRGKYNPISDAYSKDLKDTVDSCLERDYKRRPTAALLLSRPQIKAKCEQFGLLNIQRQVQGYPAPPNPPAPVQKVLDQKKQFVQQITRAIQKRQDNPNNAKTPQALTPEQIKQSAQAKQQLLEEKKKEEAERRQKQLQQKKREEAEKRKQQQRRKQEIRKAEERRRERERLAREEQLRKDKQQQARKEAEELAKAKKLEEFRQQQALKAEKARYEKQAAQRVLNDLPKKSVDHSSQQLKKPTPKLLNDFQPVPSAIIKSRGFVPQDPPASGVISRKGQVNTSSNSEKRILHTPSLGVADYPDRKRGSISSSNHNLIPAPSRQPSHISYESNQASPKPNVPLPRVRKGAPQQLSRNARNPINKPKLAKEDVELVANLPDRPGRKGSDSSDQEDLKKKSGLGFKSFKLKDVDDSEVLKRYEELLSQHDNSQAEVDQKEPEQTRQSSGRMHEETIPTERQVHQYVDPDFTEEQECQMEDQRLYQPEENAEVPGVEQQYSGEGEQVPTYQEEYRQQVEVYESKPSAMQELPRASNQWNFDDEMELADFEQPNPYLMENQGEQPEIQDQPQDSESAAELNEKTRSYLTEKLSQNLQRQSQLKQLMQLKVNECRAAFKHNYDEVIDFFRKKLNMESELNDDDEKQVDIFMRKKGLTDARKFQNIYKIMHFEMEIQNCRNIINAITRKLETI